MIKEMGYTDGESVERLWASLRHVAAQLRVAGSYTRRQILTHLCISIGDSQVWNFPFTVRRLFRQTLKKLIIVKKEVNEYIIIENLSKESLIMKKQLVWIQIRHLFITTWVLLSAKIKI